MTTHDFTPIRDALADLQEEQVLELVRQAIEGGASALELLKTCQEGMNEVGARFERQEYFVSDLMMSGEIFKQIGVLLEPGLRAGSVATIGKVIIGTVQGDIHDIGKDIVVNMLKAANMEVIDLGVDVAPARFVEALKESGGTILGMSGLLTLAFDSMKATITALAEAGVRDGVKVMVGGGPVDGNVCRIVGADDWGRDAQQAVRLAKKWLETQHA